MISVLFFILSHIVVAFPIFIVVWIILMLSKLVETPEELKDWWKNLPFILKREVAKEQLTITTASTPYLIPPLVAISSVFRTRALDYSSLPTQKEIILMASKDKAVTASVPSNEKTCNYKLKFRKTEARLYTSQLESKTGSHAYNQLKHIVCY